MTRELAPIRAELAQLTNKVDGLDGRLKVVKASVGQIRRMAAIVESLIPSFHWLLTDQMQTWNCSCGSGKDSRLEVVPFVSGDDPTTAPVCILNACLCNALLKTFISAQSTTSFHSEEGDKPQRHPARCILCRLLSRGTSATCC